MPAQYMFKDIPKIEKQEDYIEYTIDQMDKHNIERAMVGVDSPNGSGLEPITVSALQKYPDRFFCSYEANLNRAMNEVRKIRALKNKFDIKVVTEFPCGIPPQVPVNDKKWYPIYALFVDLDIPFCPCMRVPGPRIHMEPQRVEHLDEVCWFLPELRIVTRHGCEPWTELMCKLMLKYPNLHYCTSAFAPKYHPKDIIQFANTRGQNKFCMLAIFQWA